MFQKSSIDLKKAGSAGPLALDYISGKKELAEFYSLPPTLKGFKAMLAGKPYPGFDRRGLCDALTAQAGLVKNTSAASLKNIALLAENNSFTVTTGHQLCLFTGPLYFIYKIATTINLARKLNREFTKHHFIPVYWMASEDHDFEEVNHFKVPGTSVKWESAQTGAVGAFKTGELKALIPQLKEIFGDSENGQRLFQLFNESYLGHKTLAEATRHLVNELFGEHGLVIVDGNDAALKARFREEFRKDIFTGITQKRISDSIGKLEALRYAPQVNPREINVFLMEDGGRQRIEKKGDGYSVAGGSREFTSEGLGALIESNPEKLSPNVSLRPVYQQKILPNLAYIGGPGELAYWLEYRAMFEAYEACFPILVPRNFFSIVEAATAGKLKRIGFRAEQVFMPVDEIVKIYQDKAGKLENTSSEQEALEKIYQALTKKASKIDATLLKHVEALQKKHSKALDELEAKFNRALRRQSQTEVNRIRSVREALFPSGMPQERVLNFSTFYLMYGATFLTAVLEHADPFDHDQIILSQKVPD